MSNGRISFDDVSRMASGQADQPGARRAIPLADVEKMTAGGQPSAGSAASQPSVLERFGTGLTDVAVGVNQLLMHIPDPFGQTRLHEDATAAYDDYVRKREERIKSQQASGTDWARLAGNMAATAPLAVADPAIGGALSAVAAPTTSPDYWTTKEKEAGLGAVAGRAVQALGRGVGQAVSPVLRPAARMLSDLGISMTPGQMIGGQVQRLENALSSIPGLGAMIRGAEVRSIEDFNRAAIDRSMRFMGTALPGNITGGREAIAYANTAFSDAYTHLLPQMTGQLDAGLRRDIMQVINLGQNLPPEQRGQLTGIIRHDIMDKFSQGGGITGLTAQEIGTELDNLMNTMRRSESPDVRRLGMAVKELDASMDRMMQRTNPNLYPMKEQLDAGYAMFKTVQRASSMQGAESGLFTPAQLSSAVRSRDRSKDKAAFARGDALMQDLSDAAKAVLPQKVRDSGTPERGLWGVALLETERWSPEAAVALAAASAPYTKVGQQALNAWTKPAGAIRQPITTAVTTAGRYASPAAGTAARLVLQDWDKSSPRGAAAALGATP